MSNWQDKQTEETEQVKRVIGKEFPDTSVYRYNSASIRIRILDDRFEGKSMADREDIVLPLIRKLPEETQTDVTVLLLLTPEEAPDSLMNSEFMDPSPSML